MFTAACYGGTFSKDTDGITGPAENEIFRAFKQVTFSCTWTHGGSDLEQEEAVDPGEEPAAPQITYTWDLNDDSPNVGPNANTWTMSFGQRPERRTVTLNVKYELDGHTHTDSHAWRFYVATADIPIAFRATNQQNQGRPKIGFRVRVEWKNSDGGGYYEEPSSRVLTLFNTYVQEYVIYPGGDPFIAPRPFSDGNPPRNPFKCPQNGVDATNGWNDDTHAWGLRTDLREGQFTTTQKFRHQWRVVDAGRTVMTPWAFVPDDPLDEENNPPAEEMTIFRHVRRDPDRGNDYCFLTRLTQALAPAMEYDPNVDN